MKLLSAFLITLAIGFLGTYSAYHSFDIWYHKLHKPFFTPPNWAFPPVWLFLYILLSFSLYQVWKQPDSSKRNLAIFLYFLVLALNQLWIIIFFDMHKIDLAFFEIVILWLMIIITMYIFFSHSKTASWLLYPYLLWVSFSAILNFSIMRLN